jgi:hypothetical protein
MAALVAGDVSEAAVLLHVLLELVAREALEALAAVVHILQPAQSTTNQGVVRMNVHEKDKTNVTPADRRCLGASYLLVGPAHAGPGSGDVVLIQTCHWRPGLSRRRPLHRHDIHTQVHVPIAHVPPYAN